MVDEAALKQHWMFAVSAWLWALPILALGGSLFWLLWKRFALRRLARFLSPSVFGLSIPQVHWKGRAGFFATGTLALMLLALALARPLYGPKPGIAERLGVDFVVVLDVSKSMWAEDLEPNRLQAVKKELSDWLKTLTGDRMGLVLFAGDAIVQAPVTFDYAALNLVLEAASPKAISLGGTNIPRAMEMASHLLQRSDVGGRFVLLITDGENLEGDALESVRQAHEKDGITLFTVGVGTSEGAPVPVADYALKPPNQKDRFGKPVKNYINNEYGVRVTSRLDERSLRLLAEAGGGRYYPFKPGMKTFPSIRERSLLPLAQKSHSLDIKEFTEWFQLPLGLAILLLTLQALIPLVRKQTASEGSGVCVDMPENLSKTAAPPTAFSRASAASKAGLWLFLTALSALTLSASEPAAAPKPWTDAERLLKAGKNEEAVSLMRQAVQQDEKNPWLFYNYALTLYRAERFEEAANAFQALRQTFDRPDLVSKAAIQMGNAQVHLGQKLQQEGQSTGAIIALERALTCYDDAMTDKATSEIKYNRNAASQILETCLMQAGGKFMESANRVAATSQLKEAREEELLRNALQAYERVLELNEKNQTAQRLAQEVRERLARNLSAQAASLEKKADGAAEDPKRKQEEIKNIQQQALDKLDNALTFLPNDPAIQQQKENLQNKMSDKLTAQAEKQLEKPLAQDTLNRKDQQTVAQAKKQLEEALALNPENKKAEDLNNQAAKKLEQSYVQEGQKALEAADKPNTPAQNQLGQANEAASQFQKALDLNDKNEEAQKGLGEAQAKLPELLAAVADQEAEKAREALGKKSEPQPGNGDKPPEAATQNAPSAQDIQKAVGFLEKANQRYSMAQAMAPENASIQQRAEALRNELSQTRDQLDQQNRAQLASENAQNEDGTPSSSDEPPQKGQDSTSSANTQSKLLSISDLGGNQKPNTGDNFWEKRVKDW